MILQRPWTKVRNYYRRNAARAVFQQTMDVRPEVPLISFTFDDFPRTALSAGGAILERYGAGGTYYTCMGLLGKDSPSGTLCVAEDLTALLEQGHELGCHTYSHCHSWDTDSGVFEDAVLKNRTALAELIPGAEFKTLSYPISEPRPFTKRRVGKYFQACRAGGQSLNAGITDCSQLSAFFLEQSRDNVQKIKDLVDHNQTVKGWIIFATHDVCGNPSRYGCTPELFEEIVRYSAASGARILPVGEALHIAGTR
jgi:peptidoglycan/xylan/chitin deacetylase (PgdA/CDA1 family)